MNTNLERNEQCPGELPRLLIESNPNPPPPCGILSPSFAVYTCIFRFVYTAAEKGSGALFSKRHRGHLSCFSLSFSRRSCKRIRGNRLIGQRTDACHPRSMHSSFQPPRCIALHANIRAADARTYDASYFSGFVTRPYSISGEHLTSRNVYLVAEKIVIEKAASRVDVNCRILYFFITIDRERSARNGK